jgi:hypothetical protein
LNEHPSRAEISALLQDDLASNRRIEIFLHLLQPCEECLAQSPIQIRVLLGFQGEPANAAQEAADQDAAIDRALRVALRHGRHLERQREQARKAGELLAQGGMKAAENLPTGIGNLAAMEALLTRSWAARHEDPNLMAQLAFLAVKRAEKLDARRYGIQRVYDFRCRAEAELGNAYRVIDQLGAARTALAQARRFFEIGTKSELLNVRLLCLEASLEASLWSFDSACVRLTKAYDIYLRMGELHLATHILVKKGLYTSYAGRDEEALLILEESKNLIDTNQNPTLAFAASLNILLILADLGKLDAARLQLFILRRLLPHAGGRMNQLRFRWVEARIDSGFGHFDRAESALREISDAFLEINKGYDSALASLDLAAVLLAQRKAREATEVVTASVRVFVALGIQEKAVMALSLLRTACEVRMATQEMIQEVAKYMRELQIDPTAQFEGRSLKG